MPLISLKSNVESGMISARKIMPFDDISGKRYGRLVAVRRVEKKWLFACDCGNEKLIWATNVKRGHTQSCGCFHRESSAKNGRALRRHGYTGKPEYGTWQGMHQRCGNTKDKDFCKYGGRGIKVSDKWKTFDAFIADMGEKPTRYHSLDRIDVNGDYAPGNCRWATAKEQNRNKRPTIRVSAFGKTGCLADFISHHTQQYHTARKLIATGMNPADAIVQVSGLAC